MNPDFEQQLQRQPMREVPAQWRAQILNSAAQPEPSRWREWLWPAPQAWAVLGAAWIVIFALRLATPDEPRHGAATAPSFAALQEQTLMMARLLGSGEVEDRPAALPTDPKPRSERARREISG